MSYIIKGKHGIRHLYYLNIEDWKYHYMYSTTLGFWNGILIDVVHWTADEQEKAWREKLRRIVNERGQVY
jgi:hypothetical protein